MGNFLKFRTLITPVVIQIIFWLGVIGCIVGGIIMASTAEDDSYYGDGDTDGAQVAMGILVIIFGPLFWRIYCELMMIQFRIHGAIREMHRDIVQQNGTSPAKTLCPGCGAPNIASATFCKKCGTALS